MSRRAAVLGTGLIGSSVGIALRAAGWHVTAWDPDEIAMDQAEQLGAFDARADGVDEAVDQASFVVLAGPVEAIVDSVARLETDGLVTDVAGVKVPVVQAAHGSLRFVGGHPMAGRETAGPSDASGSLFRGATWVITSDAATDDDIAMLSEIVAGFGADPLVMTAAEHDSSVALSSHLPHVTAGALVNAVAADPRALELAAGGFRDLTRVALSEPGWWVDVLTANRTEVSGALREMAAALGSMADLVERQDREGIRGRLAASREVRAGMAAPVEMIGVLVEDHPGEIARVGHSLSESGVDLRDLQLRHAVHGGGGVLSLSVAAGEAERLRAALIADGFRLLNGS